jgi:endogenous inhibitor of DNA gyrase (YacG/DUF329 family)
MLRGQNQFGTFGQTVLRSPPFCSAWMNTVDVKYWESAATVLQSSSARETRGLEKSGSARDPAVRETVSAGAESV